MKLQVFEKGNFIFWKVWYFRVTRCTEPKNELRITILSPFASFFFLKKIGTCKDEAISQTFWVFGNQFVKFLVREKAEASSLSFREMVL